jgi:hypothetical protein
MKLFQFEQRHAEIIGRAMYPKGSLGGVADDRALGPIITDQIASVPWFAAIVARLGMLLIWYWPLLTLRFRTFGSLTQEQQYALMDKLARSHFYSIREMVMLVKMNTCFAAIGDPRVLRYLGAYDLAGGPVALQRKSS